ncbi:DivIVA domain-containing protein [Oryzobacter telluris]|uniref:DivIVA domain-containing protein n=1 Tax=Oryzobacter telluris TaxID=3149179 RepID=UPI00370D0A9C
MARLLRAEDVLNSTFTQTQFREGYDEREVDELLDDVVATLRRHEGGGAAEAFRMTSEGLGSARFAVTKFRRGYDREEIDAFLADVIHTLRHHEAGGTLPRVTGGASASAPRESLGARILRTLRGEQG